MALPEGFDEFPKSPWRRDAFPQAAAGDGGPPKEPHSTGWRATVDRGNQLFAQAKGIIQGDCAEAATQAIRVYSDAARLTKDPQTGAANGYQLASTYKNLFLTQGLIARCDYSAPVQRYFFLKEALHHAGLALSIGFRTKSPDWIGEVIDKANALVEDSIVERQNIVSAEGVGVLFLLFSLAHHPDVQAQMRIIFILALIERSIKDSAVALDIDRDFRRAVTKIEEHSSLAVALESWMANPSNKGFEDYCKDQLASLKLQCSRSRARKEFATAMALRAVIDFWDQH
jgi:hypothetical protein